MDVEMAPKVWISLKQLHDFMAIQARLVWARAEADIVEREAIKLVEKLRGYNVVYSNEAKARAILVLKFHTINLNYRVPLEVSKKRKEFLEKIIRQGAM